MSGNKEVDILIDVLHKSAEKKYSKLIRENIEKCFVTRKKNVRKFSSKMVFV